MKLNFDAIRELLLVIEEQPRNINLNQVISDTRLKEFEPNDLGYALEKMIESRLLIGQVAKSKMGINFYIDSISLEGHRFIDTIRNDTLWNKTKAVMTRTGATAISILMSTASDIFNKYISDII
ncbi:hypothetical protein BFM98_07255 [Lysinibacillus sp. AR18-8]|uniref:DUF2513 domain-containing protein n=1 Tax=Lysinibacillus sp. AR18-8 TaxID=1889781 RepID=UPI000826ED6B|nr:DUF2513 domain-containing protein [Lysinibacillus sp. AR18-8]OCX64828.1 hypothetical protein BFM98_07255 [Lysinibacillus sp. AR18-8]